MLLGHTEVVDDLIPTALTAAAGAGWTSLAVPLACFGSAGADMTRIDMPMELQTSGTLDVSISGIRSGSADGKKLSCTAR